jgi:hypothetical protein
MDGRQGRDRVLRLGNRAANHEVAGALTQRIRGGDDAGLVVLAGAGRTYAGRYEAEILANVLAQQRSRGGSCRRKPLREPVLANAFRKTAPGIVDLAVRGALGTVLDR